MFTTTCGKYALSCTTGQLPALYGEHCRHAELVSEYNINEPKEVDDGESPCFVGVSKSGHNEGWPFLVIAQTFSVASAGFDPGAILIAETDLLMIGAGTRLLAFNLNPPSLLWEDDTICGFWGWERHGDIVIMEAELEMAAWHISGTKLWSHSVEPPWTYHVEDGIVHLDIMGDRSEFPLMAGPAHTDFPQPPIMEEHENT